MRIRTLVLLLPLWTLFVCTGLLAQHWQIAQPGYRFEFPRDYFSHPEYQTEWWYYTGNVHAPNGHKFGFELTFFRVGLHLPEPTKTEGEKTWRPDEVYLAHFAISDPDAGKFYEVERINRAGPGLAGASLADMQIWNGNWKVRWDSTNGAEQHLQAVSDQFSLDLILKPSKPLVIHGQNGIMKKGPQIGEASHYLSFTRLLASGLLGDAHSQYKLDGIAWMDHEFFSAPPDNAIVGWDWFSIQLNDGEELMLYRLRQKSGEISKYSSGTYIDSRGTAHFLNNSEFSLVPGGNWKNPQSGTQYPLEWKISVPSLHLNLTETTRLKNQELLSRTTLTPAYWEGAVQYEGQLGNGPIRGLGYLEMTGYDKAVWFQGR